jgi:hypothetical protein
MNVFCLRRGDAGGVSAFAQTDFSEVGTSRNKFWSLSVSRHWATILGFLSMKPGG